MSMCMDMSIPLKAISFAETTGRWRDHQHNVGYLEHGRVGLWLRNYRRLLRTDAGRSQSRLVVCVAYYILIIHFVILSFDLFLILYKKILAFIKDFSFLLKSANDTSWLNYTMKQIKLCELVTTVRTKS